MGRYRQPRGQPGWRGDVAPSARALEWTARRYAWPPDVVESMAWSRWWRYVHAGEKAEADEARERYIEQAFGAWLQGAGGEKMTFPRLLEQIGLRERPRGSSRRPQSILADVARIREADRRNRGG